MKFELTETPHPCHAMFAYMDTEARSDGKTFFALDCKVTGGLSPGSFGVGINKLAEDVAASGKEHVRIFMCKLHC